MIELKRCPFCGAKAEIIRDKTFNAETGEALTEPMWFIWCTKCSALVSGEAEEKVISNWNRRADEASASEVGMISEGW